MKCPTCERHGANPKIVLSHANRANLEFVVKNPGTTSAFLFKWSANGGGITAKNQALERLRKLGLVRRERDGRSWRYYAVKDRKIPTVPATGRMITNEEIES